MEIKNNQLKLNPQLNCIRILFSKINNVERQWLKAGSHSQQLMKCAEAIETLSKGSYLTFRIKPKFREYHGYDFQLCLIMLQGERTRHTVRLNDMLGKILYHNYGISSFNILKRADKYVTYDFLSRVLLKETINPQEFEKRGIRITFEEEELSLTACPQ